VFTTSEPKGLDFMTSAGTERIDFTLITDNLKDQRTIFIGAQSANPRRYVFALPATTPELAKYPHPVTAAVPVQKCQQVFASPAGVLASEAASVDPEGEPKLVLPCNREAWATVWHDTEGWHVRANTDQDDTHSFSLKARVSNGKVLQYKWANEKKFRAADSRPDVGRVLATDSSDGLDFVVSQEATDIRFVVQIDHADKPESIFIGADATTPGKATFVLPAHPAAVSAAVPLAAAGAAK
jgi:hypothetical protein